jgi:hypothetical protein
MILLISDSLCWMAANSKSFLKESVTSHPISALKVINCQAPDLVRLRIRKLWNVAKAFRCGRLHFDGSLRVGTSV